MAAHQSKVLEYVLLLAFAYSLRPLTAAGQRWQGPADCSEISTGCIACSYGYGRRLLQAQGDNTSLSLSTRAVVAAARSRQYIPRQHERSDSEGGQDSDAGSSRQEPTQNPRDDLQQQSTRHGSSRGEGYGSGYWSRYGGGRGGWHSPGKGRSWSGSRSSGQQHGGWLSCTACQEPYQLLTAPTGVQYCGCGARYGVVPMTSLSPAVEVHFSCQPCLRNQVPLLPGSNVYVIWSEAAWTLRCLDPSRGRSGSAGPSQGPTATPAGYDAPSGNTIWSRSRYIPPGQAPATAEQAGAEQSPGPIDLSVPSTSPDASPAETAVTSEDGLPLDGPAYVPPPSQAPAPAEPTNTEQPPDSPQPPIPADASPAAVALEGDASGPAVAMDAAPGAQTGAVVAAAAAAASIGSWYDCGRPRQGDGCTYGRLPDTYPPWWPGQCIDCGLVGGFADPTGTFCVCGSPPRSPPPPPSPTPSSPSPPFRCLPPTNNPNLGDNGPAGPAPQVGYADDLCPQKEDPRGSTPDPRGPPSGSRAQQPWPATQPSIDSQAICPNNPQPYRDLGPSASVCRFRFKSVVRGNANPVYGGCSAWFIRKDLMVTNAHCIIDAEGPPRQYRLNTTAQAHVCCRVDPDTSACPNTAKFNVLAWVATRGFWEEPNKKFHLTSNVHDGAALFVQPATDQNMEPVPLKLHSFGKGQVPRLRLTNSGFPCQQPDDKRQGCSRLTPNCLYHMGYDLDAAPENANTATAGQNLQYPGDGCGGNSGGVVTTALNGETVAFGIHSAASSKCTEDGRSTIHVVQNVEQGRDNGVRLDLLSAAVSFMLPPPR